MFFKVNLMTKLGCYEYKKTPQKKHESKIYRRISFQFGNENKFLEKQFFSALLWIVLLI